MDKEGASVTEVNMNLASYIKFDDITNALVESKQTRLPNMNNPNKPLTNRNQKPGALNLETSFNLELAFNSALEKLGQPASGQETPALGKFSFSTPIFVTQSTFLVTSPIHFFATKGTYILSCIIVIGWTSELVSQRVFVY